MIGIDVAAAGLILTALGFLMKTGHAIRKEAVAAANERAELHSTLKLIIYRLTRIENHLEKSGDSL